MKQGKLLESTIEIIHQSLKDRSDTEVFANHKLKNTSGDYREFDIVIKTTTNKYSFTTVIECKDNSRPVSVDKIDAFVTKCNHIPEISKKVFVSRNGYQKASKNTAVNYGVELFHIEELDMETVSSWYAISRIQPVEAKVFLKEIGIKTRPMISKDLVREKSIIYIEGTNKTYLLKDFIIEKVREAMNLNPGFDSEFGLITAPEGVDNLLLNIDSIKNFYMKDDNERKYEITNIHARISSIRKIPKKQIKVERVISDDRKVFSTVVTHETEGTSSIKLVLDEANPDVFHVYFINNESGIRQNESFKVEYS